MSSTEVPCTPWRASTTRPASSSCELVLRARLPSTGAGLRVTETRLLIAVTSPDHLDRVMLQLSTFPTQASRNAARRQDSDSWGAEPPATRPERGVHGC